jgi:hypothetical protein
MVHLGERSPLGTRVAVRQRMVLIAPDPHDLVARDVDEDPADRGADSAEAAQRPYVVSVSENGIIVWREGYLHKKSGDGVAR